MKDLNRAQLQAGLARALSIKGAVGLALDENILPVISLIDYEASPYNTGFSKRFGCRSGQTAVAAEFSHVGVRAGANSMVQITAFDLMNRNAAITDFFAGFWGDVDNAQIVVTLGSIKAISEQPGDPVIAINSMCESVTVAGTDASNRVQDAWFYKLGISEQRHIELLQPLTLFGDTSLRTFGFSTILANNDVQVNFYGREFPLPPR